MAEQSLEAGMQKAAAGAVELTDVYFVRDLDYTEESIALLESLVDEVHYALPSGKTPENIDLLSELWGAYIGEVFRRNIPGQWVLYRDEAGETVALQIGRTTLFPMDKVRRRLTIGAEHNLLAYYKVFKNACSPQTLPG